METFTPGATYNPQQPYHTLIWVCVNAAERNFEQCSLTESKQVCAALQSALWQHGLNRQVLIIPSGCMLGCKAQGTTVAIGMLQQNRISTYQNVTVTDVPQLLAIVKSDSPQET